MLDSANVTPLDGRVARSRRTRAAIVEALVSLLEEGNPQPTVDEIAAASGASREEVCDLLNAYLATGFAEPEQVQASVAAETARTGLLDRLRGLRG